MNSTVKWAIAGIFAALALVPSVYFYDQYKGAQVQLRAEGRAPASTAQDIESLVGKHMSLPKESPSIARVSDKAALSGQAFFKQAQDGDKVLIYKKAKMAILYRPSSDRIINVSTISIDEVAEEEASPSATPSTTTPVQAKTTPPPADIVVAVYNGTSTAGVAKKVLTQVQEKYPDVIAGKLTDARGNYPKTLVIPFNTDVKTTASQIAKLLGATLGTRPPTEASPTADILIIAGE